MAESYQVNDNDLTDKQADDGKAWHALDSGKVFEFLEATEAGLDQSAAELRQQKYGLNQLPEPETQSLFVRFLLQFHNVLIFVLLAAGVVTALLEHWVDTGVIIGVVLINALIGVIQEGKAENALKAIRNMLSPQAMAIRNGHRTNLPAEQLVPGDIVNLQSGDRVPADLRIFHNKNLQIQEAMLTGESVPVEKNTSAVSEDAVLGDRTSMAYSGTMVTYGQGSGVVVDTGANTEIGKISAMLSHVEALTTPLIRQMNQFGNWLTTGIVLLAVFTFTFGIYARDYSSADMFLAAVGLVVAAIPEGLPAIMTITLAIGVQQMAHRRAIIRRLPAVETLGSVSVICSDKTGTLTRNEMTAKSVVMADDVYEVEGTGYDPHGAFDRLGDMVNLDEHPVLQELTRAALLCNDSEISQKNGEWHLEGDPTEGALMALGMKSELTPEFEHKAWPRTDVIPFESEHRFMATLHHDHNGEGVIYIKGAPERLLELCSFQRTREKDEPLDMAFWQHAMHTLASKGQRVLAIAYRDAHNEHSDLKFGDIESGLTLLGIVGMIDPPRKDAMIAVARCQSASIRVKMITGDHAATAVAIGKQMGIGNGSTVLSGHEIEDMDDDELHRVVDDVDIFARSSPEHKLRLVKALQENGHVVAMTGDGVNDAPALKRADIGIAMGEKGTEVAKEASEMVLVDDNFTSISHAVEEGRTVYDNLKKAILFILPTNGGEALAIIAAIALGRMLPITPLQILWINMITAVTLALTLAFEPSEGNVMMRHSRDPNRPILTGYFIWRIFFVSMILVVGTFGLFIWEREQGMSLEFSRTVAVNTLVMFEIFYLFNSRYITESVISIKGLFGNRYVLIAAGLLIIFQLFFTYMEVMQTMFGTTGIHLLTWAKICLVASSVFFLVEIEKAVVRTLQSKGILNL